ncbi:MAG TPA: hypothetical protein DIW23_02620 [Anaerolineae bacterium]|nr:hypothetical protein [Anaerolineae bacterium]HRJ75049.1 protease inhibitor I42 family protein [Anaerolineales bacterium]
MKKIFILSVLSIFIVGCASSSPTPNPASNTRPAITDPFQPIEVSTGETFNIVVATNPSTGYHWEIIGELSGVEFVSTEYTADEPVAPGSGGVDVWTFKAVSSGETQITFGSYPPGASEPDQTVTFNIVVK